MLSIYLGQAHKNKSQVQSFLYVPENMWPLAHYAFTNFQHPFLCSRAHFKLILAPIIKTTQQLLKRRPTISIRSSDISTVMWKHPIKLEVSIKQTSQINCYVKPSHQISNNQRCSWQLVTSMHNIFPWPQKNDRNLKTEYKNICIKAYNFLNNQSKLEKKSKR